MTCIVGIEVPDGVLIGGDSAGVAGTHAEDRTDVKVFANGPFVVGISGSFRVGQIMRFLWNPPNQAAGVDDEAFLVRDVAGGIRKLFLDHGVRGTSGTSDCHDGPLLLGYRGKIYKLDTDFQVGRVRDGFSACGSGARVALGALRAVNVLSDPKTAMRIALDAAEHFDSGVRRPFVVMHGPWSPPIPAQVEIKL